MRWLVTVKVPRNPAHDPTNKVTGPCPINGMPCSDVTGQHHTIVVEATSAVEVVGLMTRAGHHITRIEGA